MAIEFNCPYCTATIRVPDEFSGKRGSCPKCTTKLMVPDVVPKNVSEATSTSAEAVVPTVPNAVPPVAVDAPSVPPVLPTPQDPTPSVSRSLRKKRRRGKSMTAAGMIIPAVCFLAFLAVLSLVFLLRAPELKGTLAGNLAANMSVPTVNVPFSELLLTATEQEEAILAFRGQSESFTSVQMTCAVELNGSALAVDVEAGEGFSWYTVNPTTNAVLGNWIRQNVSALDRVRLKTASEAGAALCRDKIQRANGTPVELAAEHYRDDFGLNYHAKAFGFAVEAVAGKRRSFCAHEDNNGTLYFILPTGTTEFLLRGRSISGGLPLFAGEYRVVVNGTSEANVVTEQPPDEEPTADAMEEKSGDEPMSEPDAEMSEQPTKKMAE